VEQRFGIHSVAAAPILFRHSVAGALAVANSSQPYSSADLDLLEEVGRAALLHYESMERAAALDLASPYRGIADIVHDMRQPLSTLGVCTYYLELILPAEAVKAREQLVEMQTQLDCAGRILDEGARGYAPRTAPPCAGVLPEPALPEAAESLALTNSAISMVT
jgi:signal transduction histidine kinase